MTHRDHVADHQELQHVAETCRGNGHDAAPPQPPAAGVTLTDAEREAVDSAVTCMSIIACQHNDPAVRDHVEQHKAALRGLVQRLGGAT